MDAAHPTWLSNLQILSQQLGSLGLHLLLLWEKDKKKGHTILGTAAQHLLKKSCRASAALQTKRAWRGFQSRLSSWGSDLVPVAALVGSLQEVHFAGLTSMSSKRDHLTSILAELFVS